MKDIIISESLIRKALRQSINEMMGEDRTELSDLSAPDGDSYLHVLTDAPLYVGIWSQSSFSASLIPARNSSKVS